MVTLQLHLSGTIMNFDMEQQAAMTLLTQYQRGHNSMLNIGQEASIRAFNVTGMRIIEPVLKPGS